MRRLAPPLGDLRRSAGSSSRHPRDAPAAALHALPAAGGVRAGRDHHRGDGGARDRPAARDRERVLPLLLRREGRRAAADRRPHVVLVHDGDGDARARRRRSSFAAPIAHLLGLGDARLARPRRRGRPLGADELPAADRALPRRGALGRVRDRERRERADHGRARWCCSSPSSTGARSGSIVGNFTGTLVVYFVLLAYRREQLGLEFDRQLLRADAGASACRSSRRRSRSGRSTSSTASSSSGTRATPRSASTRAAVQDRVGDHVRDDRVPHRVARVRVLDRGRPRGEAHVLVRAHLPARARVVGRARARRARAVVDEPRSTAPAATSARRRRSRCSRSRAPSTPATPCSRSAAAARGGRSSTGS